MYKNSLKIVTITPVFLAMFSSNSGYLVSLCISIGMMSLSCSLRHWGLLSASWVKHNKNLNLRAITAAHFSFLFHFHAGMRLSESRCDGTSMKELKRGSFFCLFLICSKAHDWWLQNRAVSFWNHSPSVPSNLNTQHKMENKDAEGKNIRKCYMMTNMKQMKMNIRVTHSVEQRCADGFDNEVVFQAQFLQVFVKVIWIHNQMINLPKQGREQPLGHSLDLQCISMISSRLGKMVDSSMVDRSSSLSIGLEKIPWRTLSIRTWACSVVKSSERGTGNRSGFKTAQPSKLAFGQPLLRTIDDFLSFCLFLAETRKGFREGQLPPVGRVLLKLQEAWLHLLHLWGWACRGMTLAIRN